MSSRERYLDWLRGTERSVGISEVEPMTWRLIVVDRKRNPERRCARMVLKMRFILLRDAMRIKGRRVVQEKLSLREPLLGMEEFVEMFGMRKTRNRVIGRFVVAILSRRKELLTRI